MCAVISLPASLKRAHDEVCETSKDRDEFKLKWEQSDGTEEGRFTSAKKTTDERRGLLTQPRDLIIQSSEDHEMRLTVEKGRSNRLKAQMIDLTGQMAKVEQLSSTSRSNERTALAEVKTSDA